jgi:hypothetical protein
MALAAGFQAGYWIALSQMIKKRGLTPFPHVQDDRPPPRQSAAKPRHLLGG